MIEVGQYYFGDSGVKWVSFQLVLTPAYPRCYLRAPIVGAWPDFLRPSVTWMPRSGEVADP